MRILAGLFALSTVLASAAIPPAEAAQPPRVAAQDCRALAAQKGPGNVWQTWFSGVRENLFPPNDFYTASPCFASLADCKAWLYWAQSDWQKYSDFRPCRKGIGY